MSEGNQDVRSLVGVGEAVASRFDAIGMPSVSQLAGADPFEVFARMQAHAGQPEDPCLLDTIMSAVDQANGEPPKPWWHYTDQRKQMLSSRESDHSVGEQSGD